MSWLKVIIFAIITSVMTAVLNLIPILENTSFRDIAINFDCWFLFAVFIIVNCEKWWEASLKTFVFFLISQPLIYLIEVPFSPLGFGLFGYYKYWFIVTLLTLPGAAIAFQVKQKNLLSAIVLSAAIAYLGYISAYYFWNIIADFPYHLLSLIFCIALAIFFIYCLLDKRNHRIICAAVLIVSLSVSLFVLKPETKWTIELPENVQSFTIEDKSVAESTLNDDGTVTLTAKNKGGTTIKIICPSGIIEYYVTVTNGGIFVNEIT